MERILPTIDIEGTEFIIDAQNEELREKANLKNCIAMTSMLYVGRGYNFHYD